MNTKKSTSLFFLFIFKPDTDNTLCVRFDWEVRVRVVIENRFRTHKIIERCVWFRLVWWWWWLLVSAISAHHVRSIRSHIQVWQKLKWLYKASDGCLYSRVTFAFDIAHPNRCYDFIEEKAYRVGERREIKGQCKEIMCMSDHTIRIKSWVSKSVFARVCV